MHWWLKWIFLLSFALWIGSHRRWLSKLTRSRTNGSENITSSYTHVTEEYKFYNRTEQDQNSYLEFQLTIYKHGLCGDLAIPPMKRPCTPYLHIHPYQTEQFTLLQGQFTYQLGDKYYSCDIQTCPSPRVIPPTVPHTFWMKDNQEDLILIVRIEPTYKDHGLRAASFENIVGARRDQYITIWQALVFIDKIEAYPIRLPLPLTKLIFKIGSLIGQLLGYQSEYEEYTTRLIVF